MGVMNPPHGRARSGTLLPAVFPLPAVLDPGACRPGRPPPPVPLAPAGGRGGVPSDRGGARDGDPGRDDAASVAALFPEQPSWVDAPVGAAVPGRRSLRHAHFAGALACAEEAARQAPRSVEAHHNRAIALVRLDRIEEARDALTLALALGPDDPETLEAAADLHINQLPPSADRSALGLEYARRGSRRVSPTRSRAGGAARAAGGAGAHRSRTRGRGAAPARRARWRRRRASRRPSTNAGWRCSSCVASRRRATRSSGCWRRRPGTRTRCITWGSSKNASAMTCQRRAIGSGERRRPQGVPASARGVVRGLRARVQRAVAELPEDVRRDLGGIKVEPADMPDDPDLTAEKPPLSPTILGLFRGPPLDRHDRVAPTPAGRAGKGRMQPAVSDGDARPPPRGRAAVTPASAPSFSIAATCCARCTTPRSWIGRSPARCYTKSATCAAKTTGPCAIADWSNLRPDSIRDRRAVEEVRPRARTLALDEVSFGVARGRWSASGAERRR